MIIFLILLIILLGICIAFLAMQLTKIANKIFQLEDSIEQSLDSLDSCYNSLSRISRYPVLYDDPVVQQAVREIAKARDTVLTVANKLMILDESSNNESKEERN